MPTMHLQTADFLVRREAETLEARQRAALQLVCGVDLTEALAANGDRRLRIAARIRRLIERERLKGARRHFGYDLNRHIALKQALNRLLDEPGTGW